MTQKFLLLEEMTTGEDEEKKEAALKSEKNGKKLKKSKKHVYDKARNEGNLYEKKSSKLLESNLRVNDQLDDDQKVGIPRIHLPKFLQTQSNPIDIPFSPS